MKTSNISYLRNHLSEVLACVREGESVLVLDRDKPVATLSPYLTREDGVPERLIQLQHQGLLTRTGSEEGGGLPAPMVLPTPVNLAQMISEDREQT